LNPAEQQGRLLTWPTPQVRQGPVDSVNCEDHRGTFLAHSLRFPPLRKRKVFLHPPPRQRDGRSIGGVRWSSRDGAGPAKLPTLVEGA